ncbi:MAG TPA: 16S rRNA (cytidine(1402)-2'-O)-methyltransferase [Fibrobacteria bacterium]|jgi:16S rRNA (cytidine1402-2'-O)-methyltransferase|nr:16S rRNA (cytidine(1402)-2'-O)-methyltransferase [Fibrobacteria bacterium]
MLSEPSTSADSLVPALSPGLYLVATPIGNLEDITYRAVRILKSCDRILAEDTRHSRVLLDHYGIRKPVEPYHDFNKEKVTGGILQRLRDEEAIALICDAGTPGIADPAFNLVKAALAEDIVVTSIPGPSALLAALTASGLPTDRFSFENFPPKKSAQRLTKLERLKARWNEDENHAPTLGFYVAPYQILSFLGEIRQVFGPDTHVVAARELTKKFEEFRRGPVTELMAHYTRTTPRGEFVVLFHPQNKR